MMALVKSIFTLFELGEVGALLLGVIVVMGCILGMIAEYSIPCLRRRMLEKNTQKLKELEEKDRTRHGKYGKRNYHHE